ncbi:NAD-dependent epimerase/dehydratase family protein [Georgenia sp. SYP-B2076]|uniref:NAD-dependent epimerase/dehydratase family protein n=1 Tax=Georgenia sp. SYP-B2076 TaxID=2495881 RepID=UPI000F8EA80A|nr:NAD-dependent epimerase/dehydratase family protein [Georgenia sp. SYP-B2076]
MASVLLTGVAGFIGSHVAEQLLAHGWRVRGIDALTENYDPRIKVRNLDLFAGDPAFTFVRDDLVTADLSPLLDGVDAVVHLAAEPGVSRSWGEQFPMYVHRNVLATHRLLEAATAAAVPRFVYASSSSVYGPTSDAMRESSRLAPLSPYGVSKLAGECLVASYAHERGLSTVALRFFSVYGPRQRPDMALHRFIEALLDGGEAVVYGDDVQMRDFTYVTDVAEAVSAALTAPVPTGTVLNIAHGTPVSVPDLLRMAEKEVGRELPVSREPHRAGDTARTHGDTTAAAELLGWRATTDLRTGIARQVAWHRSLREPTATAPLAVPARVGRRPR